VSKAAHPVPAKPGRRTFFQWLTGLTAALAALLFAIPYVGYLLGSMRTRKRSWVTLDPVDQYPPGETHLVVFVNPLRQPWDGLTANTGAYVRNLGNGSEGENRFLVFAVNCAHLGCPVSWFPQSGLFMCPCHGGVYYENGERASGPPPRGMFQCPSRVRKGRLEIQAIHFPTLQNTLKNRKSEIRKPKSEGR
jgi:Rieske Fe-S protein